ncbi:MAG: hypothetical protein V5A46_09620 [Haloferacaceae archaeon]
MNCPRCDGSVTEYRLGGSISWVCQECGSVGVETEHGSEPETSESWDRALERFYRRHDEPDGTAGTDDSTDEATDEETAEAAATLDALEFPGEPESRERRREAVAELYAFLRKRGTATRQEFLELVDAEAVAYASPKAFWNTVGRERLKQLPGVRPPEPGHHEWQFGRTASGESDRTKDGKQNDR